MNPLTSFLRLGCMSAVLAVASTAVANPDFEDKTPGTVYPIGHSDVSNDINYYFTAFEEEPGVYWYAGLGEIQSLGVACFAYPGNVLKLRNTFVTFDYEGSGEPPASRKLTFGWYGGAVNLAVNDDRCWAANPSSLPATLGDCSITVTSIDYSCHTIEINGAVNKLGIGGQEFWVDDYAGSGEGGCDYKYDDIAPTAYLPAYSSFTTDHLLSTMNPLVLVDGSVLYGGGSVSLSNAACNDGQELRLDNVSVTHDFLASGFTYTDLHWAYGYYGGDVNLSINGDFRAESDILDLAGQTIGGCTVGIQVDSPSCGWIQVDGYVETITVGGRDFFHVDCLGGSKNEAGPDGDIDGDGDVDVDDLMAVIGAYGSHCTGCFEDVDNNGAIDVDDLMILLGNYGS
ncbi:MAG: hypothetical protein VX527_01170 [Planctomycetota bacterium]|nr:hypothetical protein [Planctomycetota bacterium]